MNGKKILITAAAQGMGRASAALGASEIATDINVEAPSDLAMTHSDINSHPLV